MYLGSADQSWGEVICVQQVPWQSQIPISILLLTNALSASLQIPGNLNSTVIKPQIRGVHRNSGAMRPTVLSQSKVLLTDIIYFAVSTFSLLFHCQDEKSEKKEKKRTDRSAKREEGGKKVTTCAFYFVIAVENNSIWHHTEPFSHYVIHCT